jgi:hypothetical protein
MNERFFDGYQEFFVLTRPMNENQRDIILECLPSSERRHLLRARSAEGWDDLLIANQIDALVDQIKDEFNEDLFLLRIQILSGQIRKVRKAFWVYINDVFSQYSIRHKWQIFEGVMARDHTNEWVLLVPSKRGHNGETQDFFG